uniref:RING-type E3 ubiquitin transferase n=1 Tax=Poecilia latipinna TaxID=48699 RepID=A0A3B3US02_9TELE
MFACCCNWLCMDSTDVDPSGRADRRHQSYTNSAFNSQPSPPPPEHTCKACGGSFDTPARKHVCVDCKKNYCSGCSAQQGLRPRLCHTCQRFYGNLLERAELMKLKVKELRDYLHLHEVSTHLCREKEELVELVLSQQSSPSGSSAPDTPIVQPPTVTSDPPDPTPHISVSDSSSDAWDPEEAPVSGRRASLSDLKSVDDIEDLSVRQLKEILARNFVDYKGCCEKWELMERVTRLYHDQQNLLEHLGSNGGGGPAPGQEENLCKICMDSPIDCVLLECGHMVTCTKCGKRMSECPICRQYVIRAVHVFRS